MTAPLLLVLAMSVLMLVGCEARTEADLPGRLRDHLVAHPQERLVIRGPVVQGQDQAEVEARQAALRPALERLLASVANDPGLAGRVEDQTVQWTETETLAALRDQAADPGTSARVCHLFLDPQPDGTTAWTLRSPGAAGGWTVLARGLAEDAPVSASSQLVEPIPANGPGPQIAAVTWYHVGTIRSLEPADLQRLRPEAAYRLEATLTGGRPGWLMALVTAPDGTTRAIAGEADLAGANGRWRATVTVPGPVGDGAITVLCYARAEDLAAARAGRKAPVAWTHRQPFGVVAP